jgi:hypothetical protein
VRTDALMLPAVMGQAGTASNGRTQQFR